MPCLTLSDQDVSRFLDEGFLLVEELLAPEEVEALSRIARADAAIDRESSRRKDGRGDLVRITVRNVLKDDAYGAIARSESIVRAAERLLDGEVYHYHHKMVLKDARVGGDWEWHQDYGYWYDTGCLFPDLVSCMIAIDHATIENGCLQVLKRSHKMGRLNHGPIGDQTGADPEHVAAALERLELVHCELAPGSAVFFHANALHRSDRNKSDHPRWAFICCYNSARNDPYKESRHPRYSRLDVLPDADVRSVLLSASTSITEVRPIATGGVT